ncbi:MAG: pantoate--beta-alanine ligase [Legionella sp.]|nr:MAG: pantoate--beta-alanine ligase [Legionella sp.]PJD98008.1 MAG: pantoate--beta-alanine ligase [Legionella sp.]
MEIFNSLTAWRHARAAFSTKKTIGFAPTMGNLHDGHASLMRASRAENDYTVTSLFVNPTQFNNPDDFTHYPRTLDADLALLEALGVDFCILPTQEALYPDAYNYQVSEHKLSTIMEGAHRPGHFNGVLTVVMKLLQLVKPTRAYFGEKDYQQYLLIKAMTESFFLDTAIKACPTVRESSGLAYSSRNNRLNKEQKQQAETFAQLFHQPSLPINELVNQLQGQGITVDYIEDYQNRRFAAVHIGDIRLIDNYALCNEAAS